jgi:hypothetical protein
MRLTSIRTRLPAQLLVAGACAAAVLLFLLDPAEAGCFPPCPFHALTGLHCPGCGTLRGLHHLLHGRVLTALGFNPLMVLCLPAVLYGLASWVSQRLNGRPLPIPRVRASWIWGLLAVILLYWVARNIPAPPFSTLAPSAVTQARDEPEQRSIHRSPGPGAAARPAALSARFRARRGPPGACCTECNCRYSGAPGSAAQYPWSDPECRLGSSGSQPSLLVFARSYGGQAWRSLRRCERIGFELRSRLPPARSRATARNSRSTQGRDTTRLLLMLRVHP